jgi:hypothetical protein
MSVWQWLALSLGALATAVVGASVFGRRHWAGEVRRLQARLEASRLSSQPAWRYHARELEGLPAPVQRYFRAVLTEGQPIVSAVSIVMSGRFNMAPAGQRWRPFSACQRVVTRRPGFFWDARIALAPGVAVQVVDSCIAGEGLLRAAVLGLFTVAQQRGRGDIAQGELMRWFAETPWYPTALLPSQGVRWRALDDHAAEATVVDGPLRVTLRFSFDADGLLSAFRAEARGSLVQGRIEMAPWEGRWSDYRVQDGMRLPFTGEVAWMRPEGRRPYFVGTVETLGVEFAP